MTSSAFANNQPIATEFTCDGAQDSPPLAWSKVPAATKSLAILAEDPDAPKGTFTHWLVTGIPPTTTALGISASLPEAAVEQKNSSGEVGYKGPCPPSGTHHYDFRVYALDIGMPRTISRDEFLKAVKGHVLATGHLVGTYQKKAP